MSLFIFFCIAVLVNSQRSFSPICKVNQPCSTTYTVKNYGQNNYYDFSCYGALQMNAPEPSTITTLSSYFVGSNHGNSRYDLSYPIYAFEQPKGVTRNYSFSIQFSASHANARTTNLYVGQRKSNSVLVYQGGWSTPTYYRFVFTINNY